MALDLQTLKLGTAVVRRVPYGPLTAAANLAGTTLAKVRPSSKAALERNLERVVGQSNASQVATSGLGSYGRYWVEALLLPHLSDAEVDRRFGFTNYHHILDVQDQGFGPILVLPHLGQWEWAAAWLGRIDNNPVTAVVERLEPAEVFDWFTELRQSYGVEVIPLGPKAFGELTVAVRDRRIICLMADRDIQGSGVEVEFFGQPTMLPSGPAVLSARTGAPILPTAVFHRRDQVHCVVGEPIWPGDEGKLRDRVKALSRLSARGLEDLISKAPEQWHVLSPVWPESGPT